MTMKLDPETGKRAFRASKKAAANILSDEIRATALADAVGRRRPIKSMLVSLTVFPRMLRAYARREFTEVPWQSMATLAGALAYFVMPMDAVPDWIPGAGLLDDAFVIELAALSLKKDVEAFFEWESRRKTRLKTSSRKRS
jgi:uncharacterized membrane protein YkvA (DUF1232 family)